MFRIDRSSKNPNLISVYTGDVCNLACTLCAPEASTRWQYELGLQKSIKLNQTLLFDDVDFTDAISVTIGGGEPVLNKSTLPLVQKIASSTTVIIHLNGTVLPSQDLLDECARFNNISFTLSIDDTEDRFEFLRYPAKWNKVVGNIAWLKTNCPDNITFSVNTVVSLLNETTYITVAEWIEKHLPTNRVGKKTECFTNESNGLLNRFNYNGKEEEYIKFLDTLDQQRNTNWRKTFPAAVEYLNFIPT
jgi:MoaA/NifB/PqqE/SkfB family radical SAM enzyme